MLAQSPGCRPEWLADFRAACQKLGERPAGAERGGAVRAPAAERPLGGRRRRARRGRTTAAGPGPWRSTASSSAREYRKAGSTPSPSPGPPPTTGRPRRTTLAVGLRGRVGPRRRAPGARVDPRTRRDRGGALAKGGGSRWRRRGRSTGSPGRSGGRCRPGSRRGPRWRPGRSATATGSTCWPSPDWSGVALDASFTSTRRPVEAGPRPAAESRGRPPASGRDRGSSRAAGRRGESGLALAGAARRDPGAGAGRTGAVPARPRPTSASPPPRATDREGGDVARPTAGGWPRRWRPWPTDSACRPGTSVADPSALMDRLAPELRYRGPFLSDADATGSAPSRIATPRSRCGGTPTSAGSPTTARCPTTSAAARSAGRSACSPGRSTAKPESGRDGPGSAPEAAQAPGRVARRRRPATADPAVALPPLSSYLAFLGRLPRK